MNGKKKINGYLGDVVTNVGYNIQNAYNKLASGVQSAGKVVYDYGRGLIGSSGTPSGSTVAPAVSEAKHTSAVIPGVVTSEGNNVNYENYGAGITGDASGGAVDYSNNPVLTSGISGDGETGKSSDNKYYAEAYKYFDDYYARQEEAAKLAKEEANRLASEQYQNAVAESQAAYSRNLLDQSKNESLASMGLTGSGYSDYLTGKAMELQRSESQAAAVARNAAQIAAANTYADRLLENAAYRDEKKYAILEQQFEAAKNNESERLSLLGSLLEFAQSGADINTLKMIANEDLF